MADLESLSLCVTARSELYSGTSSPLHLLVNIGGVDVFWARAGTRTPKQVSRYGDEDSYTPLKRGQSLLWPTAARASDFPQPGFDPNALTSGDIRLGTGGADMLELLHVVVWGQIGGKLFPVAMLLESDASLSTEWDEGRPSVPLRPVRRGNEQTPFSRVLVVYGTDPGPDSGSKSDVRLAEPVPGSGPPVGHGFRSLPPGGGLERSAGEVNVFLTSRISAQQRAQWGGLGMGLQILGDDMWLPSMFVAFGIREANGQPAEAVPLAYEPEWHFDALSTDPSEGVSNVTIPLAQL